MIVFDCGCRYRFIIGKKRVYGPIYSFDLPGYPAAYSRGREMSRAEFANDYWDCFSAYALEQGRVSGEPS